MSYFVGAKLLLFSLDLYFSETGLLGVEHGKEVVLVSTGCVSQFRGCGLIEIVPGLVIARPVQGQ